MPLFTFICKKCEAKSELLVAESAKPACPSCGSTQLSRQQSAFAPMGATRRKEMPPAGCDGGGCAGGMCPYQ